MVKSRKGPVDLIAAEELDDIDTGSRYDPDAPLLLSSCYQCDPKHWRAGKPASGKYSCKCGLSVPRTCEKRLHA